LPTVCGTVTNFPDLASNGLSRSARTLIIGQPERSGHTAPRGGTPQTQPGHGPAAAGRCNGDRRGAILIRGAVVGNVVGNIVGKTAGTRVGTTAGTQRQASGEPRFRAPA
jgi:hypothetical protein